LSGSQLLLYARNDIHIDAIVSKTPERRPAMRDIETNCSSGIAGRPKRYVKIFDMTPR